MAIAEPLTQARALKAAGRLAEAEAVLLRALAARPHDVEAIILLGTVVRTLGRPQHAAACLRRALALAPDDWRVLYNVGNVYMAMGMTVAAAAAYARVCRLEPRRLEAHANHAVALKAIGRVVESREASRRALALDPDLAATRCNLGLTELMLGDWDDGWRHFEARWRTPGWPSQPRHFQQPAWDGSPFPGRTLLVYWEQGFGDVIQFLRYLPMVARLGGEVVVEVQHELQRLCAPWCASLGVRLVTPRDPPPRFDLHVAVMSLAGLFRTRPDSVPPPALLAADPAAIEDWRRRLPAARCRIGLVWAGQPSHENDRNRSAPLAELAPLAEIPGVVWVALQKGKAAGQMPPPGLNLHAVGADLADFADSAACLKALDGLVSVDTAPVHLAGSLGLPVWLMLPHMADWRWLLGREDTPWYPTARLVRQCRPGDWRGVAERVAAAIDAAMPLR